MRNPSNDENNQSTERKRKPGIQVNPFVEDLIPSAQAGTTSVRPNDPPAITILNEPFRRHESHPINKFLRQVTEFCQLSLSKAAMVKGQVKVSFDLPQIFSMARQLKIEMPKNLSTNDLLPLFKSKQFIVQCKATVLQRLNALINRENGVELNFERSLFSFYKCFIGKGNNAPLIVQVFKLHRWWWTVYQSLQHDEDGQPIIP